MINFGNKLSNLKLLKSRISFVIVFCVFLTVLLVVPAYAADSNAPHTFYVSKNGDNSDGLSWATAWNELDQIKWSQIDAQRNDSVIIDGGQRRMVYRKTMNVQLAPSYYAVSINVSNERGHSGRVFIAPGPNANAIEVTSGVIQLDGQKRSGILVYGAKTGVKIISSGSYFMQIKNVEITRCKEAGVYVGLSNYPSSLNQLIIHDNATNVVSTHGGAGPATLNKCWIYNSSYSVNSDGIRINGPATGQASLGAFLTECVLGPGLREGINNPTAARPSLTNCLLINATQNNVSSFSTTWQNVTSFMTKLNPWKMSHSCLKLQSNGDPHLLPSSVNGSIVYGGMVDIPVSVPAPYPPGTTMPFPITVSNNTQFHITGNTTVLAPNMEDPMFNSPVEKISNRTPIRKLMLLDFSLRPNSPAQGRGSSVTSIRNLLNMFE